MIEKKPKIYVNKSISRSGWNMPNMHAHHSHELYFLVSGRRRYFIGHTIYDVSPGNLVFIPGNQLHRATTPGRKGYSRYVINFFENYLVDFIDLVGRTAFDELLQSGCIQLPANISRQIQTNLELLEQESDDKSPLGYATKVHLLQDILLCALRHGKKVSPCTGESADKIQYVAQYISENYADSLSLRDAAQMAHMEATYFSKRFKLLTGFGFQEFLTHTRLLAAQRLLDDTTLSISKIAERCGFSSSNYFGDVFRRWKGISPSVYRKEQRYQEPS